MTEPMKPRCEECFWFDVAHERLRKIEANHGYCRKELPIPRQVEEEYFGTWPIVDRNDYCGGFTIG